MKVKLGELTKIRTGKLDANAATENGKYPFFTCSKEPLKIATYSYDCECVLVAGNGDLNVKYYNGKFDAYQRTYIIEKKDDVNLYMPYLYYFMEFYLEKLRREAIGGVIKYIKLANLTDALIDLPDYEKQVEIVNILDTTKKIINLKASQIEKQEQLIKARFVEMFGDPVENPMKWKEIHMYDLGCCKNGMNFHAGDAGIEINCLGVGDFKKLTVIDDASALSKVSLNEEPSDEYLLRDGDIVFVRSNGNKMLVGRCLAVYPGDIKTTFSGFCIRYRLQSEEVNTVYLLYLLKTPSIRQKLVGRGANIQNLNQKILSELKIPVPPMHLQNSFACIIEQADKSKVAIQKSLDEIQVLFDSLMQKYFG